MKPAVLDRELRQIVSGELHDPHSVLGVHPERSGVVVRACRPGAAALRGLPQRGPPVEMEQIDSAGLFSAYLPRRKPPLDYRLEATWGDGATLVFDDPYSFPPALGELDMHLIGEGRHEELWERLGAEERELEGVTGTEFAVWAPAARSVSVVGDFNYWDGRVHPMRSLGSSGVWELFVPGIAPAPATSSRSATERRRGSRRTRLPRRQSSRPPPPRLSSARATTGPTTTGSSAAPPPTSSHDRSRSTSSISAPGAGTRWRATARSPTSSSPTSSPPTSATSASPTSS